MRIAMVHQNAGIEKKVKNVRKWSILSHNFPIFFIAIIGYEPSKKNGGLAQGGQDIILAQSLSTV
jgi:hypothetical protein